MPGRFATGRNRPRRCACGKERGKMLTTRQQKNQRALGALLGATVCACLVVCLLATRPTRGANPPSGTVTIANTSNNPVTYTAGPFVVPNPTGLVALQCTPTLPCDDYFLTVNVPATYVDTHEVRVRFAWASA